MAGQADGDRTDHAVSGMGRAPDHDHHVLAGRASRMPAATAINPSATPPRVPLELPVRPAAAQLPCRVGAKFPLQLVECGFHLDDGVSRQPDGT